MAIEPITDDERRQVAELHAQGLGRNEIAKRLGRAGGSITTIAADLGLSFDRSDTALAVEAKRRTAADRRADLALALLDDAERLRCRLWAPATVYAFGGKENTFSSEEIDEPAPVDKAHLMRAASIAVDRSIRLDEYDRDNGTNEIADGLGALLTDLKRRYGAGSDAGDG